MSMPPAAPESIGINEVSSDPPAMPPTAPAMVLPAFPMLTFFAAAPTALPPIAPAMSWMMRLMIVADMSSLPLKPATAGYDYTMLIRLLDMMPRTVISKRPCRAAEASSPSQMRLAELSLSRLSWGCKIMAAMVGYFDDSCTEGLVLTVAGLIGDERQWEQFDRTWPELLKRHDVPYFHMKEMVKPNGVFAKWLPPQDHAEERRAFFSDIVETISTCRFGAFGAIVRI